MFLSLTRVPGIVARLHLRAPSMRTRATFISPRQWSLTRGGGVVVQHTAHETLRTPFYRRFLSYADVENDIRRSSRKLDTSSISGRRTTDRNWPRRPVPRGLHLAQSSAYNYPPCLHLALHPDFVCLSSFNVKIVESIDYI